MKNPEPKDNIMAIVTVSTVFLALTPVFLALQPSFIIIPRSTMIPIYIALTISFALGLITICIAVDWFEKPTESRKHWARWLLIAQTVIFSFGSFIKITAEYPSACWGDESGLVRIPEWGGSFSRNAPQLAVGQFTCP